ncbi:MAG: glycosyltransferase [Candidatus Omnitrophica bacterium]|nr:glycosyltransferase [Candidatus Omnitrophota bacterium]
MKFVFITREGLENPGARTRCYSLSAKLRQKGLRADVFSFSDRLGAKSGKDEIDFTFFEKFKHIYKGFKLLSKEKDKPIFIVNRFNYHTIPAWLVSKLKKIPLVFDMDDWEAREDIGYYFGLFPKSKAEYLAGLFAKNSMFCIAASNYLRDYLLQFNKKVYYLPTGVDTDKFKSLGRKDKKDFIFSWHGSVNRIEVLKYIKFIIDCFLAIRKKYPFIKLVIAGDGIFGNELRKLVKASSSNSIIYAGWINYRSIPSHLDSIDVGLVPLLDKTRFNLSKSPVKLFEYMAMAKPTISSNIGEAASIIDNGENGFLAGTEEEFLERMEALIKDKDLGKKIGDNARKTVEKQYSLDVVSESAYEILAGINA